MRHNHLRELPRAGRPSLGTHVISPWPAIYEIVGRSGAFDYVEFVAEEAPFDLHDLDGIGRAVELFPDMGAMIKVDAALRDFTAARASTPASTASCSRTSAPRTTREPRSAAFGPKPRPTAADWARRPAGRSDSAGAITSTTCRRCVTWSSR